MGTWGNLRKVHCGNLDAAVLYLEAQGEANDREAGTDPHTQLSIWLKPHLDISTPKNQ